MDEPTVVSSSVVQVFDGVSLRVDRLLPLVYDELRSLARSYVGSSSSRQTLHATAVVHEAYIRLRNLPDVQGDRERFLAVAALAMRQIVSNYFRDKRAGKRGPDWTRITLSEVVTAQSSQALDLAELNELLERLGALDERLCRVVELRFFAGMSPSQISRVLGISERTVARELRMARTWIRVQLAE